MDIIRFTFVMGSATGGAAFVMGSSWWGWAAMFATAAAVQWANWHFYGRYLPPDYAQSSACALGSMETRAQAPRKFVIPAKAGIQELSIEVDSRFRGNDGLKETIYLSFVRNQVSISGGFAPVRAGRPRSQERP